jgi:hypothetical protein
VEDIIGVFMVPSSTVQVELDGAMDTPNKCRLQSVWRAVAKM